MPENPKLSLITKHYLCSPFLRGALEAVKMARAVGVAPFLTRLNLIYTITNNL
jgi:hypothetical protein